MGVVPAIAPTLGGVLQALYGWRASFFVTTAGAIALAGVIWALLPETLRQRSDASLSPLGIARSFGSLLPHQGFLVYVARQLFENTELNLTFFSGEEIEDGPDFDLSVVDPDVSSAERYRLQTDIVVKF